MVGSGLDVLWGVTCSQLSLVLDFCLTIIREIRVKRILNPAPSARLSPDSPMPKRILIADDEASVRNAIRSFIEARSQYEICEAADGDEAIKKADAFRPDLVVLDLRMPVANGIEVASRLNARMPNMPVVVFTMFEDKLTASLTKILGIAAVVPKSDGVGKLLARIEALLEAQDALARQAH